MKLFLILWGTFSLLAFFTYGIDKYKAQNGLWRISERYLLLLSLLGGAPGALLAMQVFRHKTRHARFYLAGLLGLIWQIALLLLLIRFAT